MNRWSSVLSRRHRQAGRAARATPLLGGGATRSGAGAGRLLVEELDGLLLVRDSGEEYPGPDELADVAALGGATPDEVTLVIGVGSAGRPALWPQLSELLDQLRDGGVESVRLVLSGAGADHQDRPATARRVAEAWGFTVTAPDGGILLTPGGSLFTTGSQQGGSWWRFTPGEAPQSLGPRSPAPSWQQALGRLPTETAGGYVVEQIPAGILVRPPGASATGEDGLYNALPVVGGPTVVIGVPADDTVPPDEVHALLAELPAVHRTGLRLVPGGRSDVLPLARSLASGLDCTVETLNGMPLLDGERPDQGEDPAAARPFLLGADGELTWRPYLAAVACVPGRPGEPFGPLRLLRWYPPVPGRGVADQGVIDLDDDWQVCVTWAGLAVTRRGGVRPPLATGPADPTTIAVELGSPGDTLGAGLLPPLIKLLETMPDELRRRVTLIPRGSTPEDGMQLRRLVVDYGLGRIRWGTGLRTGVSRTTAGRSRPALGGSVPLPPSGARQPSIAARTAARAAIPSPACPSEVPSVSPAVEPHVAPQPILAESTTAALDGRPDDPDTNLQVAADAPVLATDHLPAGPPAPVRQEAPPPVSEPPVSEPPTTAPPVPAPLPPAAPVDSPELEPSSSSAPQPMLAPALSSAGRPPRTAWPRVPIASDHRSTQEERVALRALATDVWERHEAAVSRLLSRMPALRGVELDAARADLIAVNLYLTATEGIFSPTSVTRALETGEEAILPYLACLSSGLRRMPSYRGAAIRGGAAAQPDLLAGDVIRDAVPLSALPHSSKYPTGEPVRYAIWSSNGRRVRQLATTAGPAHPLARDELVFVPGAALKVLGTHPSPTGSVVLLRELIGREPARGPLTGPQAEQAALDAGDRTARDRLIETLVRRAGSAEGYDWPPRCAGPAPWEVTPASA